MDIKNCRSLQVEAIASALVREYLHGKGFQETLNCIDAEMSKTGVSSKEETINSRATLAKTLRMEKLLKKNKQEVKPYKTMLEVISKYFVTRALKVTDAYTNKKEIPADIRIEQLNEASISHFVGQTECRIADSERNRVPVLPLSEERISNCDRKKDEELTKVLKPASHSESRLNSNRVSLVLDRTTMDSKKAMKSRQSLERDAGELSAPNDQVPAIRQTSKPILNAQSRNLFLGGLISVGGLQNRKSRRSLLHPQSRVEAAQLGSVTISDDGSSVPREETVAEGVVRREERTYEGHTSSALCNDKQIESDRMGNWLMNKTTSPVQPLTATTEMKQTATSACVDKFADIEVNDLDALDESSSGLMVSADPSHVWLTLPQGNPMDPSTAIDLKTLLFGSYKKDFSEEWKMQSFGLNKNSVVSYGLIQKKGGPCGVLACVQAYLLKKLFFTKPKGSASKSEFSKEDVKKCLALALANILWKVGNKRAATIAFPSSRQSFTDERPGLCDGFIEKINLMHFTDLVALQGFLSKYVGWYTDYNRYSCIAFLYSVILSKGIDSVRKDMDDPNTCLIGVHSYCSQEIVNLMLTGRASSNVFDNTVVLEEGTEAQSMFKGVTKRSDIGFLALFEHYNSCQVGENLKCPRYPIWVVCSESHFSILFLKDLAVIGKSFENLTKFDLYYYDGLLQQDREIRLSIDMTGERIPTKYFKDLVPPLELCIRTKWTGAVVDWNGTDPLL